jgi:hypothetical protein
MPTPPDTRPTQPDPNRAVEWAGYHLLELVGVTAPAVLAVTVWIGFAAITALVAVWWAIHEWRLARRRAAARRRLSITTGEPETAQHTQATA